MLERLKIYLDRIHLFECEKSFKCPSPLFCLTLLDFTKFAPTANPQEILKALPTRSQGSFSNLEKILFAKSWLDLLSEEIPFEELM